MIKRRIFTTKDLIMDIDGVLYPVICVTREAVQKGNVKYEKGYAYIIDQIVYPCYGHIKKTDDADKPGIYYVGENNKVKIHFDEMDWNNKSIVEKYSIDKVVELDTKNILKHIEENSDSYISKEDLDKINSSTDIFCPTIEPDDDILKKIVKMTIIAKRININNYKNKLENKWTLTNLKASLTKKQNMTMKYFVEWMDLLGCDVTFVIRDNGTDKMRPLKEDITLSLNDERFDINGKEELDE